MKRNIAAYFEKGGDDDYPLDKEYYRTAYKELAEAVDAAGGTLYVVRTPQSYLGNNTFARHWVFDGNSFIRKDEPLTVDIIYAKALFPSGTDARLVNDLELEEVCTDKFKTYELFADVSPETRIVRSDAELHSALRDMTGETVVLKPPGGSEGKGIHIVPKKDAASLVTSFPYLLQKFIDTSKGIPGIVEGTHDLRIISINGRPVLSFVRTPPPGTLLANVSLGGQKIEVDVDAVPEGAMSVGKRVDAALSRFKNRLYSIDLGLDADGRWKIIELNSQPGCTCAHEGPGSRFFQKSLAEHLVRMAVEAQGSRA